MELKDRLKSARLDKKMSQKDVCELADVAKSTYSQYESGDREPSREALIRLSKALGTSVDWLLDVPEDTDFAHLPPADRQIVIEYRHLNADGQRRLMDYARLLAESDRFKKR